MAYEDWLHAENADSNHSIDDSVAYSGGSSLKVGSNYTDSREILEASYDAAPTGGRVVTYANAENEFGTAWSVAFRYQDPDNFYIMQFQCDDYNLDTGGDPRIHLGVFEGGAATHLQEQLVGTSGNELLDCDAMSDGTTDLSAGWHGPWRLTAWEDNAGDLRFRVEEDADGDGSWTQYCSDFVVTNHVHTEGGGVGVGSSSEDIRQVDRAASTWYDETEVWF